MNSARLTIALGLAALTAACGKQTEAPVATETNQAAPMCTPTEQVATAQAAARLAVCRLCAEQSTVGWIACNAGAWRGENKFNAMAAAPTLSAHLFSIITIALA